MRIALRTSHAILLLAGASSALTPHGPASGSSPWSGGSDSCATPQVLASSGVFAFDTSQATTGAEGQSESLCNQWGGPAIHDDVWFEWTAPAYGSGFVTACFDAGGASPKVAIYPAGGCPGDGTALECGGDVCSSAWNLPFPVVWGDSYLIQIGSAAPGGGTGSFEVFMEGPPPPGFNYCTAAANSVSALGSRMVVGGEASLSAQSLHLQADHAPDQPAIFYFGPDPIAQPFGNGVRCVAGSTRRLGVVMGSGGWFSYQVAFPDDGLTLGSTNFQCWYRDPAAGGAGFNLSDAYSVWMGP